MPRCRARPEKVAQRGGGGGWEGGVGGGGIRHILFLVI